MKRAILPLTFPDSINPEVTVMVYICMSGVTFANLFRCDVRSIKLLKTVRITLFDIKAIRIVAKHIGTVLLKLFGAAFEEKSLKYNSPPRSICIGDALCWSQFFHVKA